MKNIKEAFFKMSRKDLDYLTDITGMGDAILLGTISVLLAVYFFALGYRREPLAILLSFLIPAAVIAVFKIAFYICHTDIMGIVSPSGHSAISISVLGIMALILGRHCSGVWRAIFPIILIALAIIIPISRTILGMHSDGDVIVGSIIGIVIVVTIAKLVLSYRVYKNQIEGEDKHNKKIHSGILIVVISIAIGLTYGTKLPSEKIMGSFAKYLRENLAICPDAKPLKR